MAPHWWALRVIVHFEDRIVNAILRQPAFHRAVGRIHRAIDERIHGRPPHDPLTPGEATADPTQARRLRSFFKYFVDELKNQLRGKPTDPPSRPPR